MQLIYRGISYSAPNNVQETVQTNVQETVEGKYHGIKIQISLPRTAQGINEKLGLIRYRGVQLVAH